MQKRKIFILILMVFSIFIITGCDKNNEPDGIKVTYELNGGVFENCTLPINQYYQFEKDAKRYISDPQELADGKITKSNYTFVGWYKDSNLTEEWDFDNDQIPTNGITLYAKWEKNVKLTYNLCYLDENGEKQILQVYNAKQGTKFRDSKNKANTRKGYTAMGFLQKTDTGFIPWDDDFKHPGGETDVAIDVYVDYMVGEYALVSTYEQLLLASNKNIYLLNDIDCIDSLGNKRTINFDDFKYEFVGNNFTIKNFKVNYTASINDLVQDHLNSRETSVYVSLFGNMRNANISNVTFENCTLELTIPYDEVTNIYISPLATSITNSIVNNVTISADYKFIVLPNNFEENGNLVVSSDEYIISIDKKSELTKVDLELVEGE